jgi:hypothetical protein
VTGALRTLVVNAAYGFAVAFGAVIGLAAGKALLGLL